MGGSLIPALTLCSTRSRWPANSIGMGVTSRVPASSSSTPTRSTPALTVIAHTSTTTSGPPVSSRLPSSRADSCRVASSQTGEHLFSGLRNPHPAGVSQGWRRDDPQRSGPAIRLARALPSHLRPTARCQRSCARQPAARLREELSRTPGRVLAGGTSAVRSGREAQILTSDSGAQLGASKPGADAASGRGGQLARPTRTSTSAARPASTAAWASPRQSRGRLRTATRSACGTLSVDPLSSGEAAQGSASGCAARATKVVASSRR